MSGSIDGPTPDASERERLLIENRNLAQRYLELEKASRRQIEKLQVANDMLTRGDSHMRILLENAAIGFALLDPNLRIVSANATFAETLGHSPTELPGEDFTRFVYVARLPVFNQMVGNTPTRTMVNETIELVARDGGLVPCRMAVSDWLDDSGEFRGTFVLVFNIGEEKRAEERLRELEDMVDELSKSRKMFLDVVSREIRSPASGIMGMSRMLIDDELSPRQAELAGVINSSASSLLRLVDDMVDASQLEADDVRLNPKPARVRELAQSVLNMFMIRAEEKGLELLLSTADNAPRRLVLDADRVRRILMHLIDNAVKFTEEGRVTLSVDTIGDAVRFMVSDTGGGMTETGRALSGDSARSITSSIRRGAGLGLSISRRLVNLMGGKFGYETQIGRGSEFHFSIPIVIPDADDAEDVSMPPAEAIRLPVMRILLADGNPLTRRIAQAYLLFDGHQLTLVDSGMDAAAMCRSGEYDIVILDLHLPKLDGMQTLRLIRDEEKTTGRKRVPVVIAGSAGHLREKWYYLRAGADDILKKPILPVELMEAIAAATGAQPLSVARERSPREYRATAVGGSLRCIDGAQIANLRQVMQDGQFEGMLRFFMEDAVPGLVDLQTAALLPAPDLERVGFAANKTKALAGYLGLNALSELLVRIQDAVQRNAASDEINMLGSDLRTVVDDTLEELKRIVPEAFATLTSVKRGDTR